MEHRLAALASTNRISLPEQALRLSDCSLLMPDQPTPTAEFIKLLTEHQSHLMGYIMASLGNYANAADVLQQTNVVLWQKAEQLHSGRAFMPWAMTVARYKILSFLRDQQRDRLVFSPEVTEAMSIIAFEKAEELSARQMALRECVGTLPESKLGVLQQHYSQNESLKQIAANNQCSVDSVKSRLKRIRKLLSECVDRRLAQWASSV